MSPHAHVTIDDLLARTLPEPNSGCWLWTSGLSPKGYGQIHTEGKTQRAHRVAYAVSTATAIPDGLLVCHKCDVRSCINPEHLFLGTHKDNVQDCVRKGRLNGAKLDDEQIRRIRRDKRPIRALAAEYGVDHALICRIKNLRSWSHVDAEGQIGGADAS